MKNFATVFVFLPVQLILVASDLNSTTFSNTSQRCVPAHPVVNQTSINLSCSPYIYSKTGYCKDVIGNQIVHGSNQRLMEQNLMRFAIGKRMLEGYITEKVRDSCFEVFNDSYCKYSFPKCDLTSSSPMSKPVCRETCEDVFKKCDRELELVLAFNMQRRGDERDGNDFPLYWNIINCTTLQYRNGGDLPECYFSRHLNTETDKLIDTGCYYGNGIGYRGNVSVTRSGYVCQSWLFQCPHRHDHPSSEYPELINASNWCRNPGGQAPDGPWCYTTNSSIRWEYCDVERCPPPAPTLAPVIKQVYSTGSNKVFIMWNPVPLPFMHGQPRGYRIKIIRYDENQMVNTTGPNVTDFEYNNLQALTNYSLSVLAFNDAGDGPSSQRVDVTTMPENSVTVRYTLNLARNWRNRNFWNRKLLKYKKQKSFIFKKRILKLFEGRRLPSGYNIYRIKILNFTNDSNSSYHMKFDITAELNGRLSWSAVQDITGRIMQHFIRSKKYLKDGQLNSLTVEASPPPPANVSIPKIEMTSVTVDWSTPLYHGPYRITNYTVQYKKADTHMSYYDAVTVNSKKTKATVDNLDSGEKYLMRVVSQNAHGDEASASVEVETRKEEKVEVLHIVLPLVAIVVLMLILALIYGIWKRKENRAMQVKLQKLRENPYESAVDWFAVLKIKIAKQWWEIPRDDLLFYEELGSGAFGVVIKAYLTKREGKEEKRTMCAVKTLKDNPTERELRDLCNEINIMSSVGDHPNLVSLIGACTTNGPLWLVVTFAPNGCLLDYLKENRVAPEYQNTRDLAPGQMRPKPISERERMRFAYEIAQGMAHLERHRYVHRDLAARNVLLGKNMVAMVSDFGMSRDIYESGAYENTAGGFLPVRWMALESLQDYTYNSKSDVWSYGVLLWEIESGGLMPYAGITGLEVVERLIQGHRLSRPNKTSRDMYEVMWQCWNRDPIKRPTFADLVYKMGGLFNMSVDFDAEMEFMPDNNEENKVDFNPDDKIDTDLPNKCFIELKDALNLERGFEV